MPFDAADRAPLGLGHAVLCAMPMIGEDEHFAVMLPDDLIDGHPEGVLKQMVPVAEMTGGSVIAIERVPKADVSKYGVIDPESTEGMVAKVRGIVEKPAVDEAPSDFAVVGRYILHPSVMKTLQTQTPGAGGEIQLTDALAQQVETPGLYGFRFSGRRFDCGNKHGFLTANIYFGLR